VLDSRTKLLQQGALAQRQVDESAAAFAQAEAQFNEAQEHLKALESVTNEEQIKGAAAQVASAKAHLAGQESQVAFTRIESPIAGVVADRPVNVGDIANPGMPLMTVMNTSRVIARVNVPQGEAGVVKPGQPATVTQPDSKDEIEGKVTVVSPAADPNTTTVQVWIQIDNSGGKLKPGTAVHASIATEIFKAATVAPVAAILPGEEGGTAVLVVSADNVVHKRTVTLGVREGGQVQILSGANPGEEVVISGGMGLDDKAKVKIITTQVEETDDDEDQQGSAPPATDQKKDQAPKK
jgi:RND family efflux transporter MFP subunit